MDELTYGLEHCSSDDYYIDGPNPMDSRPKMRWAADRAWERYVILTELEAEDRRDDSWWAGEPKDL